MIKESNCLIGDNGLKLYRLNSKNDFYPFYEKMKNELINYYPSFEKWFNELFNGYNNLLLNRVTFVYIDTECSNTDYTVIDSHAQVVEVGFCGVIILKREPEQKICTLWISPRYRRIGIGYKLIEHSMHVFIPYSDIYVTCPAEKANYFSKLVNKFGFYKCNEITNPSKYKDKEAIFLKKAWRP